MIENVLHIFRGLFGLIILVGIAVLISRDRKNINWKLVGIGISFILAFAFLMLKFPPMQMIVEFISGFFIKLVDFSDAGAAFLFGDFVTNTKSYGYIFAFHVLPNIIFFSALSSLLYYLGILPKIVSGFAWLLSRTFHLSGAECTAAAANVFLGQITAPLMIKPYLPRLSRPEMFCVMTSGMATISGTVMLGIISILGGDDPEMRLLFAKNLLTASILSAPAALLISHIIFPKPGPVDSKIDINKEDLGLNIFDSIVKGTDDGIRVALTIGAVLIVFTALISMSNWILKDGLGELFGINSWIASISNKVYPGLTLQSVLAVVFAPIAWIIGIDTSHLMIAGQLLGEKIVLNEFVAYIALNDSIQSSVVSHKHSMIIISYALCSFANLTSIGVQISGFSAMASNQRYTVSKLALLAVVSGNLACLIAASVAGIFITQ